MPLPVSIKSLKYAYNPDKPVLKELNLDVASGEKLGIIGPSGSGKSTLLLQLNGVLRGEGTIKIGDVHVTKANLHEIRRMVGLVFQNPDDQLFNPTVEEDVAFGPLNFGLSPEEVAARVKDALSIMHLDGFEKLTSHHLSFGERKRVALATVLAMQPEVIALDEPFSNLDPSMVHELMKKLSSIDASLLIVSQSILPLIAICDRLAILENGRIIAVDHPKKLAMNEELMQSTGLELGYYCKICKDLYPCN